MRGRTCLVTGATSGHGEAVAKALAAMGADLVIHGRSSGKCERVAEEIRALFGRRPSVLVCDLSSRSDVKRAAEEFLSRSRPLHVLVNNAGQVNEVFRETADGVEETFAVNYLAMFQLTLLFLPRIIESVPARIINVSSDTHRIAHLDLEDPEGRKSRYSFMASYARSKLAIVYFTIELARRLEGTGITVNAVDPGPVASAIARKQGMIARLADWIIQRTFPSPEKAARTAVWLATDPAIQGESGCYYRFMKKKEPKLTGGEIFGARLWEMSERMTGTSYPLKKN